MSGVLQENSRGVIEEGPERGRKHEQQKGRTEKRRTPQHAWRKALFFSKDFFFLDVDHFKVFIEFITILFLFYVLVFWPQVM